MSEFFVSAGNAIVDRSADELIGAVIVALGIALAMAGLYCVGRRNIKQDLMPIIILLIVANLASMAVGSGYIAYARRRFRPRPTALTEAIPAGLDMILVETIFRGADKDRDGLLSREEASHAADSFVRDLDPSGKGLIDARSLSQAIVTMDVHGRGRIGYPPRPPAGPGAIQSRSRRPERGPDDPPRQSNPHPPLEPQTAAPATAATDAVPGVPTRDHPPSVD